MNGGTIQNSRAAGGRGGAVGLSEGSSFIMNSGTIYNCLGTDDGGGVYVAPGSSFVMNGGTIQYCVADGYNYLKTDDPRKTLMHDWKDGGAVYVDSSTSKKGTFTMNSGTILENQAEYGGGVYMNENAEFVMNSGTLKDNNARQGGGVFLDDSGNFTMHDGTITAPGLTDEIEEGGAVYLKNPGSTFTMNGGTIADFSVSKHGAAVCQGPKTVFTMNSGTITDCISKGDGGAIFMWDDSPQLHINGGTITECKSTDGSGGAIYVRDSGRVNLNNMSIQNCYAEYNGGAIFGWKNANIAMGPDTVISNCNLGTKHDGDYKGGGAVAIKDNSRFTMNGGTITDCNVGTSDKGQGGAIFVWDNAVLDLHDGTIKNCKAPYKQGGAIYLGQSSSGTIVNETISGCSSKEGGAIYLWKHAKLTMDDLTITDCEATSSGGAIYINTDGSVILQGSTTKGSLVTGCRAPSYAFLRTDKELPQLGGKVVIKDNLKTNGVENNLYIPKSKTISLVSHLTDSDIGITTEQIPTSENPVRFLTDTVDARSCFFADDDEKYDVAGRIGMHFVCVNYYDVLLVKTSKSYVARLTHGSTNTDYRYLGNAINAAQTGDTITLLADVSENADFSGKQKVILDLNGHSITAGISTDPAVRLMNATSLTITDSAGTGHIGGSLNSGVRVSADSTLDFKGGTITGNQAANGGGIFSEGTVTVTGGKITGNIADSAGGAIYSAGELTVNGTSVITGNFAQSAAGIYYGGTVFLLGGTPKISGNIDNSRNASNVYLAKPNIVIEIQTPFAPVGTIGVASGTNPPRAVTKGAADNYSDFFTSDDSRYYILNNVSLGSSSQQVEIYGSSAYSYVVSFDTLGVGIAPQSQQIAAGGTATSPADPVEQGYRFNSWTEDSNGTGTAFDFTTPITRDLTLYANWTKLWTVSFEMMGIGTSPDGYPTTVENGTVIAQPPAPTADGYVFNGWNNSPEGSGIFDFSKPILADTVIYANWTKNCTVTFDFNGHNSSVPATINVLAGEKIPASSVPAPTEPGWTFEGWYYKGDTFDFATNPVTDDMCLYARWTQITYTVEFDSNCNSSVRSQTVPWGGLVDEPQNVTKPDSVLLGWYNGSTLWNFATDRVYGNMTLNASWQYIDSRHHVGVGQMGNAIGYVSPELAKQGETVKVGIKAFDGAYITNMRIEYLNGTQYLNLTSSATKDTRNTYWNATFAMPGEDVVLNGTARYQAFLVEFNASAGGTVSPQNATVRYGEHVPEPTATKATYTLTGWYYGSTLWNFATDKVYDNMTLNATWKATADTPYTITVENIANGIIYSSAKAAKENDIIHIGIRANDSAKIDALTVDGTAPANITKYEGHDKIWIANFSMPAHDVVVSGICTSASFLVKFDGNGGTVTPKNVTVSYGGYVPEPYAFKQYAVLNGWKKDSISGSDWNFASDKVYAEMTLYANWTDIPLYSITSAEIANGTIYTANRSAFSGETIPVTITADEDYNVTALTYNGNPVTPLSISPDGRTGSGTFTMPAADVILNGSTGKVNFTVDAEIENGRDYGTFTVNMSKAKSGEMVQFNATPNAGYVIDNETIAINEVVHPFSIYGTRGIYNHTIEDQDVLGTVSFISNRYTVTIDNPEPSAKLITNRSVAEPNETVNIVSVPGIGRNVSKFTVTNSKTGTVTSLDPIYSPLKLIFAANFTMPKSNVVISAEYTDKQQPSLNYYTIKKDTVSNGAILARNISLANKPALIVTKPDEGYWVDPSSVSVESTSASNAKITVTQMGTNLFQFTVPSSNVIITAKFVTDEPEPYVPSSSRHGGGTVIRSENQENQTIILDEKPDGNSTLIPTPESTTRSSTSKSPAPFVGLLVGIGAAALFLRLRK